MNKPKIFVKIGKTIAKSNPKVLTAVGLIGMAAACVMAASETPKALDEIHSLKREHAETGEHIKVIEYVKAVGPKYVKTCLIFAAAGICILESDTIQRNKELAAIALANIYDESRRIYKDKVIETIGSDKEDDICRSIDKDLVSKPSNETDITKTSKGNSLCYDALSGRYFRSSIEEINASINRLNNRLNNETYISLNDMYEEFELECTEIGDLLGWHADFGLIEPRFSSQIAYNDEPCVVMHLNIRPSQGYDDYHSYYEGRL